MATVDQDICVIGFGDQKQPGDYRHPSYPFSSFRVVRPFPEIDPATEKKTFAVSVMAGASTHGVERDYLPIKEHFRLYAYVLGHRLAEIGLTQDRFEIMIPYGGGQNGTMGDVAWGARDAYAQHGRERSNLASYCTEHFFTGKDEHHEINEHLLASIVINGTDLGFSLRKRMMFDSLTLPGKGALITLPGGLGTLDETGAYLMKRQQGIYAGHSLIADLPMNVEKGRDAKGFWAPYKKILGNMYDGGKISGRDQSLVTFFQPEIRLDRHMTKMLVELCRLLGQDFGRVQGLTPYADIVTMYERHKSRSWASQEPLRPYDRASFGATSGGQATVT